MSTSEHTGHHIVPQATYLKVFGGLIALTILTVLAAQVDFGSLGIVVAVAIAAAKASLVVLFFMGLKYDSRVNTLVFFTGLTFVAIFLTFTLIDTSYRGNAELAPENGSGAIPQEQVERAAPAAGGH